MKIASWKFFVAGLFLGPLTHAYAIDGNVVPPVIPGFGISIATLFLQPDASNLNYAVKTEPLPVPAPSWTQELIDTSFHPAIDVGLQYIFSNQVDQIKIDWLYLNTDNTASDSATGTTSITPPYYFGPGAQALSGSSASSSVQFNVNNVNLIFEHLIALNHYIQVQPFAGITTAYLKQKIVSSFLGADALNARYAINTYNTSKVVAVGPHLGVNATAFLVYHFGVIAELATSLLVGSIDSTTNFLSFGAGNTTLTPTQLADQSQTRVIPELEGKLGIIFAIPFQSGYRLNFQAGYLFMTYIDGINQVFPTELVPNAFNQGTIAVATAQQQQSNFDLNGPYFNVTFVF